MIYEKQLEKVAGKEQRVELKNMISDVILRLGELELQKDDFSGALKMYMESLKIKEEIEDPKYSRKLAEIYF